MAGCVSYARPIWESASIRPYLGVFAFHSWDSGASDAALAGLYDFGRSTGLPIRTTEGGWDAQLWQRPTSSRRWTNALRLATVYVRVLKLTGASTLQYWQMLGRDYMLNDGASGYPAWQVVRQMQQQMPGGLAGRRDVGGPGPSVLAGRARRRRLRALPRERRHRGPAGGRERPARRFLPAGPLERRRLRPGAGPRGRRRTVSLTLQKESVTLLTTRRHRGPDWTAPEGSPRVTRVDGGRTYRPIRTADWRSPCPSPPSSRSS